jgi:hypothetical protein
MAIAAMNMVPAGGFSGISFHLRRCPQGVASVLGKKTPIFGSRRSKLDHLTVIQANVLLYAIDDLASKSPKQICGEAEDEY